LDIHEYQAKEVLANFGVAVPDGALAYSPEQATYRARELGGARWVVKAQIHAGGRGKAGGVKVCASDVEIQQATEGMFGQKMVTHQTGPEGKGIYRVYVEAAVPIDREIYLGFVLDRSSQRVMIVASAEGGMEIEEISADKPESIVRAIVEPAVGLREFQCRQIAFKLGIEPALVQQMVRTLQGWPWPRWIRSNWRAASLRTFSTSAAARRPNGWQRPSGWCCRTRMSRRSL